MSGLPAQVDVAIVGLGPGGAMAALSLARSGVSVIGIERGTFPRYKVCGGCLNARALDALSQAGLNCNELGGEPVDRFEGAYGHRRVSLRLPEGLAVSRGRLDSFIASAAADAGADVRFNAKCTDIARTNDDWALSIETDGELSRVRAKRVICADGLSGTIRKRIDDFQTTVSRKSYIGAGVLLDNWEGFAPGAIHMAVGRTGYVGLTVVESGRLNVAAAMDSRAVREAGSPSVAAGAILESCGIALPEGFTETPWKGTPPLSQRTRPVGANGIFLVGDSSGYVEPFTGEGMSWALDGAQVVSKIIVEDLQGDVRDSENRWNQVYSQRFSPAQRRCRRIALGLRSPTVTVTVAEVLGAIPALAGPVIGDMNAPAG